LEWGSEVARISEDTLSFVGLSGGDEGGGPWSIGSGVGRRGRVHSGEEIVPFIGWAEKGPIDDHRTKRKMAFSWDVGGGFHHAAMERCRGVDDD